MEYLFVKFCLFNNTIPKICLSLANQAMLQRRKKKMRDDELVYTELQKAKMMIKHWVRNKMIECAYSDTVNSLDYYKPKIMNSTGGHRYHSL